MYSRTAEELHRDIEQRITVVKGKFRQEEIMIGWKHYFHEYANSTFPVLTLHTTVSSGTYIRSLVHAIGMHLGIPTMTLRIVRTHVGSYAANQAITLVR